MFQFNPHDPISFGSNDSMHFEDGGCRDMTESLQTGSYPRSQKGIRSNNNLNQTKNHSLCTAGKQPVNCQIH